jgi:Flp pilus assembly protein TadG
MSIISRFAAGASRTIRSASGRDRRGSATVEFAVLLPILMTIALLCVDFGRFAHSFIAVTNAARAGAGEASLHPVTPASRPAWEAVIHDAVETELASNSWYDPAKLEIPSPQSIEESPGVHRVVVEVRYPFETVINWPFLPGYNEPVILKRVVVMRTIR